MRSVLLLQSLITLVDSQFTLTDLFNNVQVNTATNLDGVPVTDLRDVEVPTYSSAQGSLSQVVPYATQTAIAAASADQQESPLSVFPAATSVAINAAGDDGSATPTTTALAKRNDDYVNACPASPLPTIANVYGITASNYDAFKADETIAAKATEAATPPGYFVNFKNYKAANNAYAYLGYEVFEKYDPAICAKTCDAKDGCLSFNIYFELDPVSNPSKACPAPKSFVNIKCSYWGSALDTDTAVNDGQWREQFHVAIAGSNAYSSDKVGKPLAGWSVPAKLGNAVMNAPLRDCQGTWTYMGYKLFNEGPFEPELCSAACESQDKYSKEHPPSDGSTIPLCSAFGTYQLNVHNDTGSYVQGQMCTMYTSNWDSKYAVNTVSYDDSIHTKYTYSWSLFYSKDSLQPKCPTSNGGFEDSTKSYLPWVHDGCAFGRFNVPGFESFDLSVSSSTARTGANALQFARKTASTKISSSMINPLGFNLKPGQTYNVGAYFKIEKTLTGYCGVSTYVNGRPVTSQLISARDEWTKFSSTVRILSRFDQVWVNVVCQGEGTGNIYMDDTSVVLK